MIARTGQAKAPCVKFGDGEAQSDVARSFNLSQATISRLAAPSPFEANVVAA
jgi:DNA-binding transcriptional regulator LsrR (DeoR family)